MNRLLHIILIAIGCVTWCIVTMAQDYASILERQRKMFPQEKVYVMTDRDLYLAGDTARMRAWIYDCLQRKPQSQSKYLYVELRDAADNLKVRVKLSDRGKGLRGYLALPPTLTSGDYTLAAYTFYMLGTSEELFFKKRLHIMNPKDVTKGILPNNLMTEQPLRGENVNLRTDVPAGSNVAISITADRLCLADSTSSIVWALEHQPDVFMQSSMPYEIGQALSGTVYGNISTKKPQEGVRVNMVIPSKNITDTYITKADGRFFFNGFDLPDSTLVLISAKKGKRNRMENITFDSDSLPDIITHLPASRNYFRRSQQDVPSDMRLVSSTVDIANTQLLAEITVKGEKKERVTETYQNLASRTLVADELMDKGIFDLETAILHMPGVQISNGVLSYRGKPLRFFIDGFEEGDELSDDPSMPSVGSMVALSYPMDVIQRIDFIRPEDTPFLMGGAGKGGMAAICITLKDGADIKRLSRSAALKMVWPLGYQKYKPFHIPQPDKAWPVIYWKSNLTVKDETHLTHIIYGTIAKRRKAGDRGRYTVHIDGFTPDGTPLHVERTIR